MNQTPEQRQPPVDGESDGMGEAGRSVETMEYAAMMRRMLASWQRRLTDCDMEDLAELVKYEKEVRETIAATVAALRERGDSWATIARAFGTTKQNVGQRFGPRG